MKEKGKVAKKYSNLGTHYALKAKDDPRDRIEVEVGDSKTSDFKPQIKIMRWDKNRVKRDDNGRFVKGNIAFNRTGIPHTKKTKKKLKKTRSGRTPNMPKKMVGKQFGRWEVIEYVENTKPRRYLCICECGTKRDILGSSLRSGQSKSCGCLHKERLSKRNSKYLWSKGRKGVFSGKKRPKHSERMSGKNNPNWNGGITTENHKARYSEESLLWRDEVFSRDDYTCKKCGQIGGNIHAHHILNFAERKDKRFDIGNSITLCENCHRAFHSEYGIKSNNEKQLEEFLCQK